MEKETSHDVRYDSYHSVSVCTSNTIRFFLSVDRQKLFVFAWEDLMCLSLSMIVNKYLMNLQQTGSAENRGSKGSIAATA